MSSEHLFAKINLANLVIWQLAKIYAKLKTRLSPRVCYLSLVKLKIRSTKITGSTTAASHPVVLRLGSTTGALECLVCLEC